MLLSLAGERGGRLGLTVRADIPPVEHAERGGPGPRRQVVTDRPERRASLVVVSEAPDGAGDGPAAPRAACATVASRSPGTAVPMAEVLLVRDGRWWSYDCPRRCCAPGAGTPLPGGVSELEVAAVAGGMVVGARPRRAGRPDRPAAGRDPAGHGGGLRAGGRRVPGGIVERGRDAVAEASWTAVPPRPGALPAGAATRRRR